MTLLQVQQPLTLPRNSAKASRFVGRLTIGLSLSKKSCDSQKKILSGITFSGFTPLRNPQMKPSFPPEPVTKPAFRNDTSHGCDVLPPHHMNKNISLVSAVLLLGLTLSPLRAQSDSGPELPPPPEMPPLPAPPLRPIVLPLAQPDFAEMRRLTPRIEIWRANALTPQVPMRRGTRTDRAFVTGTEPVTVRIQFDRRAAGAPVAVMVSDSFSINPPEQVLAVSARGDCIINGQLAEGASRGHITIRCGMITTIVPLVRASLARVQAVEATTGTQP